MHKVHLTPEEREECRALLLDLSAPESSRLRALILMLADHRPGERALSNEMVARLCDVDGSTVSKVKASLIARGFEMTVRGRRTGGATRKLTTEQSQTVLGLFASPPPPGNPRWTVRSLALVVSERDDMPPVSRELVRRLLKEHGIDLRDAPVAAP